MSEHNLLAKYGGAWQANLALAIERRGQRTVLANNQHSGPLRIQKPLWPEGEQTIHLLLLHPPGGLAGGDVLDFYLQVGVAAQGLLTTPGAGKFYRADSPSSYQVRVQLAPGAQFEWLPQETIIQDGVQARSHLSFELAKDAAMIGCEILVFGRKAMNEQFTCGQFEQGLQIRREGHLLFEDQSRWLPPMMASPVGLAGRHVSALFWACRTLAWTEDEVAKLEADLEQFLNPLDASAVVGVSQICTGLCLIRAIGSSVEALRQTMHQAWALSRNKLFGRAATWPRIWQT